MTTPEQQALQLAAQAWCTPATSGLEMDVNLATAVAEKFAPIIAENAALKAELERERMRLVACGVVALADTPESAATARKMHPDYESASCADVAWRVDECIRLRAELEAIKQGAGEPVAWIVRRLDWPVHMVDVLKGTKPPAWADVAEPLYTRPCVSLTDEKVKELICEHFVTGENLFNEVHQDYRFRSRATERNVWGRDLLAFARDVEAHIKGAK